MLYTFIFLSALFLFGKSGRTMDEFSPIGAICWFLVFLFLREVNVWLFAVFCLIYLFLVFKEQYQMHLYDEGWTSALTFEDNKPFLFPDHGIGRNDNVKVLPSPPTCQFSSAHRDGCTRQSFPNVKLNSVWASIVGSPIWSKLHFVAIKSKTILLKCIGLVIGMSRGCIKRVDFASAAAVLKRLDLTAVVVVFHFGIAFKNFDVSSLMGFLFRLMLGAALAFLICVHVTGSYLPTTEYDLSGHGDDRVKKPWKEPTSKFKKGQYVYYRHSNKTWRAKILRVYFDDDLDPFYDVKLGDAREKQTTEDHLSDELGSGHIQVFIDIFDDDPDCDL